MFWGLVVLNFQAFVDESYSGDEFVLGGHIATAENWAILVKEWEELLPNFGLLAPSNKFNKSHYFHMAEMAQTPERMERVRAFYNVIQNRVATSISCRINLGDFKRGQDRARDAMLKKYGVQELNFGLWGNPYFFTFRVLVDQFHQRRNQFKSLPPDETVDFIFDEKVEQKPILEAWDQYLLNAGDKVRPRFGATPRFESDLQFEALQTADLWAWWVRKWYQEWLEDDGTGVPPTMRDLDFGSWCGNPRLKIVFGANEGTITAALENVLIQALNDAQNLGLSFEPKSYEN
ncbi:MAG: hypothetical protein QOF63_4167 [Thermoanaerobaculia bacterium]|jgi:hypothetical protein|nr:hypothetical protein [Thermoanaerobaculia bacterium]